MSRLSGISIQLIECGKLFRPTPHCLKTCEMSITMGWLFRGMFIHSNAGFLVRCDAEARGCTFVHMAGVSEGQQCQRDSKQT